MPRRGPKGLSPEQQRAHGETRPSRKVVALFAGTDERPDPEAIDPPRWMTKEAKVIWQAKVQRYRQRGQKIDGFQDALAQYCSLEAELQKTYRKELTPTMAMVSAHRMWAAEFFDTPASQKVSPGGSQAKDNAFARNGRRDAGA
jgi:phage terminase small subunit